MLNSLFVPVVSDSGDLDQYAIDNSSPRGTTTVVGGTVYSRNTTSPAAPNSWDSTTAHADYLTLWRAVYVARGTIE